MERSKCDAEKKKVGELAEQLQERVSQKSSHSSINEVEDNSLLLKRFYSSSFSFHNFHSQPVNINASELYQCRVGVSTFPVSKITVEMSCQ